MLDVESGTTPAAEFRTGTLDALPVEDESIDLAICSLALTHVETLEPAFTEFARVLRPGGTVITTDMHPMVTTRGSMAVFPVDPPEGAGPPPFEVHYVPNLVHHAGSYVSAMAGAGLRIEACREPSIPDRALEGFPSFALYPDAPTRASPTCSCGRRQSPPSGPS